MNWMKSARIVVEIWKMAGMDGYAPINAVWKFHIR